MFRAGFLAFLLATSILAQECDLSLFDLVITYTVTVENAGTQPAFANVRVSDVSRGAYIPPGHSVSVTSFAGGKYTITVVPFDPSQNASLAKLSDDLDAKLADPDALSQAELKALTDQLLSVKNQIFLRESMVGAANCTGVLTAGEKESNRAPALFATATNRGLAWTLSGC
jgi:uncharacterized repeat protein (TIGR01451 family)